MPELGPVLLAVLGIALARMVAAGIGIPSPVLLVLGGLAIAGSTGAGVELEPEVILTLVLPPLLYSAALDASLLDFRANARDIGLLSVGLVIFTTVVVGSVAYVSIPDLPWAAALALGAVLGPPDAVAAIAIGRRVGMPARLQTLIEGEGLLNDATALVLFQVAVAAVVSGFALGDAALQLLWAAVGGTGVGLAVAWAVKLVRRRLEEALVENVLSLATPFLAYLPAEHLHTSGVLAVVVCGLVLGHATPTLLSSTSRLQTGPVWRVLVFVLEGAVFLLIGLQLPDLVRGLGEFNGGQVTLWSTAVVLAVLLSRPLWVFPAAYLPRRLSRGLAARDPDPTWQQVTVLSWTGMRGVVSLAAALTLPADFPQRSLLLFLVFVAILSTLLLQGLTLGRLVQTLGLRPDRQSVLLAQANAQQSAARAALARLDEVVAETPGDAPVADRLRRLADLRAEARWERLGEGTAETPSAAWRRLRAVMLEAERAELLRLRDAGRLPDEAMREMQAALDYEEAALFDT